MITAFCGFNCLILAISGVSVDSPHDSSQEGLCGDCQKTDSAWSQCESHQQGKSGFISDCMHCNVSCAWQQDKLYVVIALTTSTKCLSMQLPVIMLQSGT